jgi:repressor LexA
MSMNITARQLEVLHFIRTFQAQEGFPPSLREICHAFGLVSSGSIVKHLNALERHGHLARTPGKKRTWKLTDRGPSLSIPVIGQIAAGQPILAEENRDDTIPLDPAFFGSKEAFALHVKGDSMIAAQIRDGDLAIIRPQQEADNGDIVAVLVEGMEMEGTLKIWRHARETIELHAANPAYQPLIFTRNDRSRVTIVGKLIGIIRPRP